VNAVAAAFSLAPGLALGSFLNVVAARVPLKRSVVSPPSACMSCGEQIAWHDNIPVASWLLLRGRCRHCSAVIPWVYPAVELTTAVLVAGCVLTFGVSLEALVAAFFCAVLVVVSATDLAHRIIPNRVVLPASALVLAAQTALHPSPEWAIAALGASGFLLAAALIYPAGMGMGDVKLALLMGPCGARRSHAGHAARPRPLDRPPGPARLRGPEDGDPLRALSGLGLRDRAVLGRSTPRRLPGLPLRAWGGRSALRLSGLDADNSFEGLTP
jgi:leader peptidase (prepilin peptidase)/N-methyltransferase